MIQVKDLTKKYAGFTAVRNINFEVKRGEIVGFLGPNGAGKSTTMKILSGYLPPTDGSVKVAGHDVVKESLEVRKRIGYMPENMPLYTDMRVDEYLRFRAHLKGVASKKIKDRVEEVKSRCSIKDVERKIIGTLSKGYRQRVGLADAMVHEPELLILDEPTIGLDPHQIRSVRDLIKDLGKHHTILLSTHILSEVEMTCSRVIIINRGRIEASDTVDNLTKLVRGGGAIKVEVQAMSSLVKDKFQAIADVDEVEILTDTEWTQMKVYPKSGADIRDAVYGVIRNEGWNLRHFNREGASLEDVFVELTQD
ncbi:MAG: ATP-binding cassette domain-containing protein [Verrucomicrobiota bacterium]